VDAGGRNCTLVLGSNDGFTKMTSAIGLALWLQHWHWYPMMHFFSLALTPTFTIGLNRDLKFPKSFEIQCNNRPSLYAYPKKLEEKKEEKKKRVETVTLSTTAKNKARLARKKAKEGGMDVDESEKKEEEETKEEAKGDETKDETNGMELEETAPKKREPEPASFRVSNPSRITKAQSYSCAFDLGQRWHPVRPSISPFGVIVLKDSTPKEPVDDLGAVQPPSLEGECEPPQPFEWKSPVTESEQESATDKSEEETEK
jgi:26S proteasome regulatory subunit N2